MPDEHFERLKKAVADRYVVEREIGSGGMATVYLAEDVRHHRNVALKVLRPELAAALGASRFLHEIEIAAQLQHPNILPLLDSGEADGILYYVMPYVDGPSLRDRIANQGELPVHDAVKILCEVVDALAEAHEKGIVHRDVKPDNVLLTGRHAMVTDFGVAKAVGEATGRHTLTTAGVALGTPTYMAPEQAAADPHLDARVDIYAVGVVAYEMLAGTPPFTGGSPAAVLGKHVTEMPKPLREHRPSIPPPLEQVVMRCLAKRPADRWQSAEELLTQLEPFKTPSGGVTPVDTRPVPGFSRASKVPRGALWVAGAVVVAGVALALLWPSGTLPPVTFGQTRQVTLDPGLELDPALSPDGRLLAYAAGEMLDMHIYVRGVAGGNPVQISHDLPGEARMPRWSPDGTQILFSASGGVYVAPALGGAARLIAPSPARYATWSPDGKRVAYVDRAESAIYTRVVEGGTPRRLAQELDVHSLSWSPDGRFIAFVSGNFQYAYGAAVLGNLGPSAVFVVPVDGGDAVQLTDRRFLHMSPVWSPDGKSLLMVSTQEGGRDVYRIPIGGDGRATGSMERLTTGLSAGTIGMSPDGKQLAYSVFTNRSNVWRLKIPSSGTASMRQAEQITRGTQHIEGLGVSRDGQWLAFDSDRGGNVDIYKMRLPDGEPIQLTTDPSDDFLPAWSADGQWIAFHSWRNGNRDVYVMPAAGGGEQQVTDDPAHDYYGDWAPDGTRVAFHSERTGTTSIFIAERTASGWSEARQLTTEPSTDAKWSPDGTRIAYNSGGNLVARDLSGFKVDTLVRAGFRHGTVRYGVRFPAWPADGRTLYFNAMGFDGVPAYFAVPATGGTPRLLVRMDDPSRPSGRQEFTSDGTYLYFTVDNRQADIWVMSVEGLGK